MGIYFYIGFLFLLVLGFILARKDAKEGIIPDEYTNTGIIFAVVMYFFAFGFFSFQFYLYFTILLLLYLFFMYLQRAMHYTGKELGTGDIKFFLLIYSFMPFHTSAFCGIPIFTVIFWTLVLMISMITFKILYYLLLRKVPIFKIMYGSTIDKTAIRLAPLIYISLIITFFILL
jgi:hypothetical protein